MRRRRGARKRIALTNVPTPCRWGTLNAFVSRPFIALAPHVPNQNREVPLIMATHLNDSPIYGPVHSRRLGLSLVTERQN